MSINKNSPGSIMFTLNLEMHMNIWPGRLVLPRDSARKLLLMPTLRELRHVEVIFSSILPQYILKDQPG